MASLERRLASVEQKLAAAETTVSATRITEARRALLESDDATLLSMAQFRQRMLLEGQAAVMHEYERWLAAKLVALGFGDLLVDTSEK